MGTSIYFYSSECIGRALNYVVSFHNNKIKIKKQQRIINRTHRSRLVIDRFASVTPTWLCCCSLYNDAIGSCIISGYCSHCYLPSHRHTSHLPAEEARDSLLQDQEDEKKRRSATAATDRCRWRRGDSVATTILRRNYEPTAADLRHIHRVGSGASLLHWWWPTSHLRPDNRPRLPPLLSLTAAMIEETVCLDSQFPTYFLSKNNNTIHVLMQRAIRL